METPSLSVSKTDRSLINTQRHHLLTLPLEMRREIYRHLLTEHDPIKLPLISTRLDSPILRTCRQVLEEAAPALYSDNWFSIIDMTNYVSRKSIITWLRKIGKKNRSLLRHLEMDWANVPYFYEGLPPLIRFRWVTEMEADAASEDEASEEDMTRAESVDAKSEAKNNRYYFMTRCLDAVANDCCQLRNLTVLFQGYRRIGGVSLIPYWTQSSSLDCNYGSGCYRSDILGEAPAVMAALRRILAKIPGMRVLRLGYTRDFDAVEKVVEGMEVGEVQVLWKDLSRIDTFISVDKAVTEGWGKRGWVLKEDLATKTLPGTQ